MSFNLHEVNYGSPWTEIFNIHITSRVDTKRAKISRVSHINEPSVSQLYPIVTVLETNKALNMGGLKSFSLTSQ